MVNSSHYDPRSRQTLPLFGVAALTLAIFMQLVSWGEYAIEILPLEARSAVGALDPAASERLAQICLDLKKLDCVEREYRRTADAPAENRVRLGEFLFRRGKFTAAVDALGPYFAAGGQDVDAAYTYARALGETGRMEDAAKYFDYVLGLKPETLQVTVVQAYVRLLVQNGRFEDALRTIDRVRGRDQTIAHFMEPEYRSIRARMGSRDS